MKADKTLSIRAHGRHRPGGAAAPADRRECDRRDLHAVRHQYARAGEPPPGRNDDECSDLLRARRGRNRVRFDLTSARIPNWLTFSAAIVGLCFHTFPRTGRAGARDAGLVIGPRPVLSGLCPARHGRR